MPRRYRISTRHPMASGGIPVIVDTTTGKAYHLEDVLPNGWPAIAMLIELDVDERYAHLYPLYNGLVLKRPEPDR